MADQYIDFSPLTLNPEEARSGADLIFAAFRVAPEIVQTHTIMTGVRMQKYIPILGQRSLVGKVDPGSCGNNDIDPGTTVSQKMWDPKTISGKLADCQDNIEPNMKFWLNSDKKIEYRESINNEYQNYVMDNVMSVMKESVLRIADFGDTTEDTVANGKHLTNGTDKTYFNILNGIWPQIFADQAGPKLSYRYTITENSVGTYAAQQALAADTALQCLRNMYNNIDSRAFKGKSLVFQMTRSLFNNWSDFMEDKSLVFMLDRTETGATKFTYRGIPIVIRYDWDDTIRTYYDNGTTFYIPHRAWLTDLNNIPIGTLDTESLSALKSWYSNDLETHFIKFAYSIDCKLLLEYALASAY